jgi:DNA-directed RNA polymerase specialized sigma24 family protein
MRRGGLPGSRGEEWNEKEPPPRKTEAELVRLVRNAAHRFVRALAGGDLDAAVAMSEGLVKDTLEKALKSYQASGHGRPRTDPKARAPANTLIENRADSWRVEQILVDPEDHNDWSLVFDARFDEESSLNLRFESLGPIGGNDS